MTNLEPFEALTSVQVVFSSTEECHLKAGTRFGCMLTFVISLQNFMPAVEWQAERYGLSAVYVFSPFSFQGEGIRRTFACCDESLVLITYDPARNGRVKEVSRVWVTESNNRSISSPTIHSVAFLGKSVRDLPLHDSVLMLSGHRILVTDIGRQAHHVPRQLSLSATPTRLLFSATWNCLVVAVLKDDRPTLAFIDPETGLDIAKPLSKERNVVAFISGLGHPGDRILGLHEWRFVRNNNTFEFLLVTTKQGRLLILDVYPFEPLPAWEGQMTKRTMQYWTRYRKRFDQPIYSVVGDTDGLAYCVDRTLHWDILEPSEKKLKPMKEFELDSPATTLTISHGKIVALTTMHSIQVLDHRADQESEEMTLVHADRTCRATVHMTDVGQGASGCERWPVTLMSNYTDSVAAVLIPWNSGRREFKELAIALVGSPVRRFARVRRPPMLQGTDLSRRFECMSSRSSRQEILGVSMNGLLQHFTLLSAGLCRLLRLIILAARSMKVLSRFTREARLKEEEEERPDGGFSAAEAEGTAVWDSKAMHVDGDELAAILERSSLGGIFKGEEACRRLFLCLDGLEDGRYTSSFRTGLVNEEEVRRRYLGLAEEIVEHLLSPVL